MEEAARVAAEAAKVAAEEASAAARAAAKEVDDEISSNSSEAVDKKLSVSGKIREISNNSDKMKNYKESRKRNKNSVVNKTRCTGNEKGSNVVNSNRNSGSSSASGGDNDSVSDSDTSSNGSDSGSDSGSDTSNSGNDSDSSSNSSDSGSDTSNSGNDSDTSSNGSDSGSDSDGDTSNSSSGSDTSNSGSDSDGDTSSSGSDSDSDSISSGTDNVNSSVVSDSVVEAKNVKTKNISPDCARGKQRKVCKSSSDSSISDSNNANLSVVSDEYTETKNQKTKKLLPNNVVNKHSKVNNDSIRKDANSDKRKSKNEGNSKKRQINSDVEENSNVSKKVAVEDDETNRKMYIRGLPWRATEDEVREYFSTCGEIISIDMPIMDDGRSSGTAIINFKTKDACETCLELNGSDFNGRWLNIKYSTPKPIWSPREPSQKVDGCTTVFVGNLSFQIEEETLREVFGECGEIIQVRFAEDRETGQFKGFGHIEFANTESTNLAVKMTGTDIMGRPVRVDFANPRKNTSGGGRGRVSVKKGGKGYDGGRGNSASRGGGLMTSKRKSGIMQFSGSKTTFD